MIIRSAIEVGKTVIVTNNGRTYSTFTRMANILQANSRWAKGRLPEEGESYVVRATHVIGGNDSGNIYLLIEDCGGYQFIINQGGVTLPEEGIYYVVLTPVRFQRVAPSVTMASPSPEDLYQEVTRLITDEQDRITIMHHDGRTCNLYGYTDKEAIKSYCQTTCRQSRDWLVPKKRK